MQGSARGTNKSGGKVPGENGNAGERRGIQGNASRTYGSGCIVPGECWNM